MQDLCRCLQPVLTVWTRDGYFTTRPNTYGRFCLAWIKPYLTFPDTQRHHSLTCIKFCCLVKQASVVEDTIFNIVYCIFKMQDIIFSTDIFKILFETISTKVKILFEDTFS